MSFVVWAALAIAGLVVGPVVAHLLRRGRAKEQEFPAAALVPRLTSTARQRSRIEDYPLLVLRSLMIVGLAVLGATPLVRCERLSLARSAGGSVALAIVLDDSLSMRATVDGGTRWDTAKSGAQQLLRSARDGDAVAVVLAGHPARIALSPTTDLAAAARTVDELAPSDRATDLPNAVQLARASLRALPQQDHRVVVLSDLASDPIPDGSPRVSAPLPALAKAVDDCGIASAERRGPNVTVRVACTSDAAARGRSVEIVVVAEGDDDRGTHAPADGGRRHATVGDVLARVDLPVRRGEQSLGLATDAVGGALDARLSGSDAMKHDDTAPVSEESAAPVVAVLADSTIASAKTGGATVIEQALDALSEGWATRPLPFVPDDAKGLAGVGAIVLDDPRGFSPEARETLVRFLAKGGVALALLGPRSTHTELGWTLEPFGHGAARWEESHDLGVAPDSVAWLGPESTSLGNLTRRGRVRLDGMEMPATRVAARWTDGAPFIFERQEGRGLVITVGLPASLDESDFAVRPGFLAVLDHALRQADQRVGSRRAMAGSSWVFPDAKRVTIDGPEGAVAATPEPSSEACLERGAKPGCGDTALRATAAVRGRYSVLIEGQRESRIATIDPAEILAEPHPMPAAARNEAGATTTQVAATRELSLLLIALFGAELGVRTFRRWADRRRSRDPAPAT